MRLAIRWPGFASLSAPLNLFVIICLTLFSALINSSVALRRKVFFDSNRALDKYTPKPQHRNEFPAAKRSFADQMRGYPTVCANVTNC